LKIGVGIKFGEFHRIAKIAANIWDHIYTQKSHTKDMVSVQSNQSLKKKGKFGTKEKIPSKLETGKILMSQLINYKENQDPYNILYDPSTMTPYNWWSCIEVKPNYIQQLAKKLFAITPHAASCERIWSTCGWLYGKKRCNLSVERVEALAKIHSYYVSNCKEELKIAGENISENEILETFLAVQDDNESEDDDEDDDDDDIETLSHEEENNNNNEELLEPYVLIIQNTMDLSHYNFQDPDENLSDNESENLYEDNILVNDDNNDSEEEYNSNELASSFVTALDSSDL
jgi:hypothetical protein